MQLKINRNSEKKYIYEQIYDEIKHNILERRLIANEQLPSKRVLAEQLHVSVNSVTRAYEQLLAEGYIYTIERTGYFIENITHLVKEDAFDYTLPTDLREENKNKAGWLSFSHISIDATMFPFNDWLKCEKKAIEQNRDELTSLTHFQGPLEIRKSIATLIAKTRGVICEPEQIVIGAGTQLLIERLVSLHEKKTKIAIEDPGYHRIYNLLKRIGYDVKPIRIDVKGMHISELHHSNAQIAFVTPSHQFPTGTIMPISRRHELLNWATQHEKRYIVEDDYDSEYKYETNHIPSLQSLDRYQQVVYTGTFSKTILPSLRISYLVLPFHLLRKYRERYSDIMHEVSATSLYTLYHFIQDGLYEKHVQHMTIHYENKRKKIIAALQHTFQNQMEIIDVPAGLHFLTFVKTDKTYSEIIERANEEKLEIYTLERFKLSPKRERKGQLGIVIGIANLQVENIDEAVRRLWRIINRKKND